MGRLVGGSKGKCMFSNHGVRIFKVRSGVGIGNGGNIIKMVSMILNTTMTKMA